MNEGAALLRMLEPAVRPVPTGGGAPAASKAPFEQQSFESLLAAAEADGGGPADAAEPNRPPPPPSPLSGLNRIENASLRELIAERAG